MTYETTYRQNACKIIASIEKTILNQVLAIFCQVDGFNRADFFVHPCVSFYDSLHADIMLHGIENKQVDVNSLHSIFNFCTF